MHLWNWLANETFTNMPNITDISADVANSSTDINDSVILVSVMDFTDVPMLYKNMADIGRYRYRY